jgi:ABC transport system ATP-binding/permease protein
VRSLSGGERNRLLLARLFAKPVNVLVLDEPTNDLDIDTIELLEDLLQQYVGTVFLVSHDRRFLDNVVTSTLVAEGAGLWREYEGDVSDWLAQSARSQALAEKTSDRAKEPEPAPSRPAQTPETPVPTKRKLSYKEQRLLQDLPAQIEALEAEQTQLQNALADGQLYVQEPARAAQMAQRLNEVEEAWLAAMEQLQALS